MLRWLRAEADPPCPWSAATEARAKAHFGEAEVASWGGPPPVEPDSGSSDEVTDDDLFISKRRRTGQALA